MDVVKFPVCNRDVCWGGFEMSNDLAVWQGIQVLAHVPICFFYVSPYKLGRYDFHCISYSWMG